MVKRDTIAFAGSESRDGLRKWNREVGIAVDSDEVTTIGARTRVHPKLETTAESIAAKIIGRSGVDETVQDLIPADPDGSPTRQDDRVVDGETGTGGADVLE